MGVSVIVPALNEETTIAATVAALRTQRPRQIIVVDGGSGDATVVQAAGADLVLSGPRGRAAQMNHGAAHAEGEVLLFLHADCRLEMGALTAAERCLERSRVAAGCFKMRVESQRWLYRSIDACATLRVRLTGIVYGDQGLFVRRDDFLRWGGFPAVRFMEDVLFSLTLRRHGRVVVAPRRVFVSPRRWERTGVLRQTLRNWTLTGLAAAGVHPDRMATWYPAVR